ncbi:MAG: RHS repeat-associated core domain-containing protein, partial [Bacteroidales bacterium]|nr:RHS repeat-associated core domain-containing protein [Bacteroidales bacterium]
GLTEYYVKRANKGKEYEPNQYFYHPDHLGSSSFITNAIGYAEQLPIAIGVQYLPFGELFVNQQISSYSTRYKFSAKLKRSGNPATAGEKDDETQYSYFGARYYDSDLSVWLSVDPISDRYPSLSPYAYVANNPIKLVDPNGEDIYIILYATGTDDPDGDRAGHTMFMFTRYEPVELVVNGKKTVMYKNTGVYYAENNIYYRSTSGRQDDIKMYPAANLEKYYGADGIVEIDRNQGGEIKGYNIEGLDKSQLPTNFDPDATYASYSQAKSERMLEKEIKSIMIARNPNAFDIESYNCTDFAVEGLSALDINVSAKTNVTGSKSGREASVSTPNMLLKELKAQGYKVVKENYRLSVERAVDYIEETH